jgi:post-segregation antitoxin (ccd killing protein)
MESDDNKLPPKRSETDRKLADRQTEFWLIENKEAIESSNAYVAKHGLPLARFRQF